MIEDTLLPMLCAMLMTATMNNPVIPGWYADPELLLTAEWVKARKP